MNTPYDPLDAALELLIDLHENGDLKEFDEDPEETEGPQECPECGGDDIEIVESTEFMRGKVYQCLDCLHVICDV